MAGLECEDEDEDEDVTNHKPFRSRLRNSERYKTLLLAHAALVGFEVGQHAWSGPFMYGAAVNGEPVGWGQTGFDAVKAGLRHLRMFNEVDRAICASLAEGLPAFYGSRRARRRVAGLQRALGVKERIERSV